jgi:hypothetical protein
VIELWYGTAMIDELEDEGIKENFAEEEEED